MRKLATAAAVSLALASGGAFGIGLGDIEMRSALNQPMSAEIRLTSVKTGELDGMIVQLASVEAFARAGIERSTVLTDLQFSVDSSSGVPVIRISSEKPVIEPFLNFLLEVDWPQGRMVREYTVLLDPPVFMTPTATERNTTADQPALVDRGTEALVVPTPIERDEGVEVDLADLVETPDVVQPSTITATAEEGEIVSLDVVPDNALLAGNEAVTLGSGDVVALTDLGAPNKEALAQRELDARQKVATDQTVTDEFTVELFGDGEEVSDTTVIGGTADVETDGSTIVSLGDLSQPEAVRQPADFSVNVSRGDTLYEIAQDNSKPGVSVQQMMMALLAANENAFINKNINLVKAGSILRVPEVDEATRLTQRQALAAIGQQNQLWQEYRAKLRGTGATRIASGDKTSKPVATAEEPAGEPVSDTTAIESAAVDPALKSEESIDGLSAEARAILDKARTEILDRDELRLVADNAPTSTTASATADETADSEANRLGEVNRKLQLAREELSSTRLQSEELSDQASELQGTTENLDALVALRQNEIAQLESQLTEARKAAEENAGKAEEEATAAAEAEAIAAAETEAEATAAAESIAEEIVAQTEEATSDATEAVADSGVNALTEAGEDLAQVELVGDEAVAGTETVIPPPKLQTTWYQDLMDDPKRMAIAGVGAVGLLGVLGTLMFRRKRRKEDDLLDIEDEADFTNDKDSAALQDEMLQEPDNKASDATTTTAAVAAAAAMGGASAIADPDHQENLDKTFDDLTDVRLPLGADADVSGDGLDGDDTLSEVEVYLAYGLHGQAEELLSKATERDPDNQLYAQKLIQTYHAQGNSEGFHAAASSYHARFGGESNPEWPAIAAMGTELLPRDALYASGHDAVNRVGAGHSDGAAFGEDDFLPAQDNDSDSGSVSRDFQSGEEAVDFNSDDESSLLDHSLDPAFAFDEGDLEATGDFSETANYVAAEQNDGSIDFPDFDAADSSDELPSDVNLDLPGDLTNELSADLTEDDGFIGEALTIDELDRVASVDDLTLDLDQLSGELDLDSSELMNADLSDLDLPDLSVDNDLFGDNVSIGDNSDEMDTMLDLAKAYIDMGDKDSASSALDEIVKSGSPAQVTEAETLLRKIS